MNDQERLALRTELATMRTNGARRQDLSQHACKRLFFDFGIRPSMATVRDLTLTGSASDIPKDIDAFWARSRSASRVRIEGGALPEGLQERAGELLGHPSIKVVGALRLNRRILQSGRLIGGADKLFKGL